MSDREIKNGRSLVLVNTLKGETAFESIKHKINIKSIAHENAFRQAALLPTDRNIPEERKSIYESIGTGK
jgi:hypothetical protein